jgi:biopolymer transport protein ExbD
MAKKVPEINASSTADMAFLLLTFFLMTTTMTTDMGIARDLPPLPPEDQKDQMLDINKRNILAVYVNPSNAIMVGGERMDISQIAATVKEFVLNPTNNPDLSESEMTEIEHLGAYPVSKGVVSLENDRRTNYTTYIQVQNELTRAFNEIRDEVAKRYFGRSFAELQDSPELQTAVRMAVQTKISEAELRNTEAL